MKAEPDTRRLRILIVDPDREFAAQITRTLQTRERAAVMTEVSPTTCDSVQSLRELHEAELDAVDLTICAMELPDGTGVDALAYVLGVRPGMAVILTSHRCEPLLASEAVRLGALEFLVKDGESLQQMPLIFEKCLAHHRVKLENQRLHRALARSLSELADKNAQLQQLIERLESMARTDPLTGLSNRRWLNDMLDRLWAEALRHGRPLAFAMIDLDGFKQLNDRLGHLAGDRTLELTGRVLQANCRQVDVAARYGGDEFCVVMPNTELHEAIQVCQRITCEFSGAIRRIQERGIRIGMSIGISHLSHSSPASAEQLVAHADEALYAAKSAGRGRILVREPDEAPGSRRTITFPR